MATPIGDDTFEVTPRPVGHGRRQWTTAVAALSVGLAIVVAAALAGGASTGGAIDVGRSPIAGGATEAPQIAADSLAMDAGTATPSPPPRPMPASMACHNLDSSACRLAVAKALGQLGSDVPAVDSAEVWSGIVCGDTLDCPPTRLDARTTPLASVILRLVGGGPAAWINVVYRSHGRPLDFDPTLDAWIARWQAPP